MNRASRQAFLRSIPITLPYSRAFSGDGFRVNEQLTSYAVESNQTFQGMRFWEWIGATLSPLNHYGVHPNGLLTRLIWGSRNAFANLSPQSNPALAVWPRSRNVLGYEPWP